MTLTGIDIQTTYSHFSSVYSLSEVNKTLPSSQNIGAVWNTGINYLKGTITGWPFAKENASFAIQRYSQRGTQLKGNALSSYLELIELQNPSLTVHREFFISTFHYSYSDETITRLLDTYLKDIPKKEGSQFISIPIAVSGHITHLLIQVSSYRKEDGGECKKAIVEFFDPKGLASNHKNNVISGTSIQQMIGQIEQILTNKGYTITRYEHRIAYQNDIHNCGVFVGWHLKERALENQDPIQIAEIHSQTRASIERIRKLQIGELKRNSICSFTCSDPCQL